MHRVVLGLADDDPREVDHRNRDRLDNRRLNLRVLPAGANPQNVVAHRGSSSRFRGVAKAGNRWRAMGWRNGRRLELGRFDSELDAALAAQAFRDEYMPYALPDPELGRVHA